MSYTFPKRPYRLETCQGKIVEHTLLDSETRKSLYKLYRDYIIHEDGLINYRLTWMLTIHGFLYTSYALTVQSIVSASAQLTASRLVPQTFQVNAKYLEYNSFQDSNLSYMIMAMHTIWVLLFIISIVGLLISWFALRSIKAANRAIRSVAAIFELGVETYKIGSGLSVYNLSDNKKTFLVPTLTGGGGEKGEKNGLIASETIPVVLIFSWIVSLIYDLILLSNIW